MEVFAKPKLAERNGTKLTDVNTYVVVPDTDTGEDYSFIKGYKSKTIELVVETNDLKYKIDVSLDLVTWHPIKAETVLAVGFAYETNNEVWNYLRVQVKPNVAATHGTMSYKLGMSSL